jgi:ABC-type Na+ efflux pump permease subunit
MNKNVFKGLGQVFKFTLKQNVLSKAYIAVTVVFGIILAGILIGVNVYMATDNEKNPIETIYLLDESKLSGIVPEEIEEFLSTTYEDELKDIEIKVADKELVKVLEEADKSSIGMGIKNNDGKISVEVIIPEESDVSKNDGEDIAGYVAAYLSSIKIMNAGLTPEQLAVLFVPIEVKDSIIGKEVNLANSLVKIVAPMVFSFIMYMMLIIYGQSISKNVSSEKTTKLMEYILTSTKPYALITGKIFAMTLSALIQFVFWVLCVIVGFVAGDKIGKAINPEYKNVMMGIIDMVRDEMSSAFSWQSLVLAIAVFAVGFLFYCSLSGLISSFPQKTEELQQCMVIFQYIVIAGFFIVYFDVIVNKEIFTALGTYLPFCSPFSLPANIIIGEMSVVKIAIALGILVISTLIVLVMTARVYKSMILFNGAKITPEVIRKAFVGKM